MIRKQRGAPGADRIVDKMPAKFACVGLIHLALPHARIVDAYRDPVDTCLSCCCLRTSSHTPTTLWDSAVIAAATQS
jgi:Sulfotransferase family